MEIHRDLTIAYLPIYIWQWSFDRPYIFARSGMRVPQRVDFGLYCAGNADYICRRSPFTRFGESSRLCGCRKCGLAAFLIAAEPGSLLAAGLCDGASFIFDLPVD